MTERARRARFGAVGSIVTASLVLAGCALVREGENVADRAARDSPSNVAYQYGSSAVEGQFPFMVEIVNPLPRLVECGGSLISDKWVLTAKHCFSDNPERDELRVRVGSIETNKGTRIKVERFVLNPDTDLALAELSTAATGSNTGTVPFERDPGSSAYEPGANATTAGWGATRPDEILDHDAKSLVYTDPGELRTLDSDTCDANKNNAFADLFCAGHTDTGDDTSGGFAITCQYDSGGPFLINSGSDSDPSWTVAGVLSSQPETEPSGPSCGPGSVPDSWADVAMYSSWIEACLAGNAADCSDAS